MDIRSANIALINMIPDEKQQEINNYLSENFCKNTSFAPKTANDIYQDLEESRKDYENGNYKDFDDALLKLKEKYGL